MEVCISQEVTESRQDAEARSSPLLARSPIMSAFKMHGATSSAAPPLTPLVLRSFKAAGDLARACSSVILTEKSLTLNMPSKMSRVDPAVTPAHQGLQGRAPAKRAQKMERKAGGFLKSVR